MTLKELNKKLNSLVDNVVDKTLMDTIGKTVSKTVKTRTREGFGVKRNKAAKTALKPLSPKYIERRRKAQAKLSSNTSASTSNLTKTGQMLDDITYKATNNEATIFVANSVNDKKTKHGKKARPFMNLAKDEFKDVVDIINRKIKNDIKKQGL